MEGCHRAWRCSTWSRQLEYPPELQTTNGHERTQRGEAAATLECADLSALSAGDLSPSDAERRQNSPGPLDAALLWRQVAKAAKAVTSHRTPNFLPAMHKVSSL